MSVALNTKHLSIFISEEEYAAIYPQVEAAHNLSLIHISAALDALVLIDDGTAALPCDGLLGAHFHTEMCIRDSTCTAP